MASPRFLIQRRRERRSRFTKTVAQQYRRLIVGAGIVVSFLLAVVILAGMLFYADLTGDLPPVETLPALLNPPDGALLQPTRIYDRTGEHLVAVLSPFNSTRRYLPLGAQNPQHLPESLVSALVVMADPNFWSHAGFTLNQPDQHPTIAQKLVNDLLLWNEPPGLRRALRERILAAQLTDTYGRQQLLEWYLNSADFGNYAYSVDTAAQFYLGKSASALNPLEAAMLIGVSQAPALNPLDAPQAARQRAYDVLQVMHLLGELTEEEMLAARQLPMDFIPNQPAYRLSPAFTNLIFSQLGSLHERSRLERGGIEIISTMDFDLQQQAECTVRAQLQRLGSVLQDQAATCDAARLLPAHRRQTADGAASVLILEPSTGQVLAFVGEIHQGKEQASLTERTAGSSLMPLLYLTGFTRGLSPSTMLWDIPPNANPENHKAVYHGPVRLRYALVNDYPNPAADVYARMGDFNVGRMLQSFGLHANQPSDLLDGSVTVNILDLAQTYAVFANRGAMAGYQFSDPLPEPYTVQQVVAVDGVTWLDWRTPQTSAILSPQLAYLMTHVLSDESVRWQSLGYPNPLEIGRPVGAKLGNTQHGRDTWVIGFTPQRVVVVWSNTGDGDYLPTAGIWHAIMQYASRALPPEGWDLPAGVSLLAVCDPSGLLPSAVCPNIVQEVFLHGNEPTQVDNLYQAYQINRETGFLATVFTPAYLVEERIFVTVPPEARIWAELADIELPPFIYDAIQVASFDEDVHISSPTMLADVRGKIFVRGSARGAEFSQYRLEYGAGLNPVRWIQIGVDTARTVNEGVLAEWDTSGLNGLFALRLLVIREDQTVEMAITQVSIDNQPPVLNILSPADNAQISISEQPQVIFAVEAHDNMELKEVRYYVEQRLVDVVTSGDYSTVWRATPGKHTLRAVAVDRVGNQTEQTIIFTTTK